MDMAQRLHHILAIAMNVGDLAVLPHPDAFIDAAPQMLGELAKDVAVDLRPRLGGVDGDMGHRGLGLAWASTGNASKSAAPRNVLNITPPVLLRGC